MAPCLSRKLHFLAAFSLLFTLAIAANADNVSARLQNEDMSECWNSLLELRACTGEVILFFLNGETNLGPACCGAIRFIEHRCWPSMLTSLGFTPDEGDILTNYCDARYAAPRTPPAVPLAPNP